jgi:hypothetical protein
MAYLSLSQSFLVLVSKPNLLLLSLDEDILHYYPLAKTQKKKGQVA